NKGDRQQQVVEACSHNRKPQTVPAEIAPLRAAAEVIKDQGDDKNPSGQPHPSPPCFFHKWPCRISSQQNYPKGMRKSSRGGTANDNVAPCFREPRAGLKPSVTAEISFSQLPDTTLASILFTYWVSGNVIAIGWRATPSPGPPRLIKAPVAFHPLLQGGEGCKLKAPLPSPPWGRGAGEGV